MSRKIYLDALRTCFQNSIFYKVSNLCENLERAWDYQPSHFFQISFSKKKKNIYSCPVLNLKIVQNDCQPDPHKVERDVTKSLYTRVIGIEVFP